MSSREGRQVLVSIVVAVHNEELCVEELHRRLDAVLGGDRFELIFVDDGSTDRTFELISDLAARDPRVRGVRLSRNVGHQAALFCGMELTSGQVIITLDGDLQHPPELVPAMLAAWRHGFDVVHMRRRPVAGAPKRLRDVLALGFYRLFNLVADVHVAAGSTDFRLLDRGPVEVLATMRDRTRFLRAMVRSIGFAQTELLFDSPPRFAGKTSYTIGKLGGLAVDALVSSCSVPVAVPLAMGIAALAAGTVALRLLVLDASPLSTLLSWLFVSLCLAVGVGGVALLGFAAASASRRSALPRRPLYRIERMVGAGSERRMAGACEAAPIACSGQHGTIDARGLAPRH